MTAPERPESCSDQCRHPEVERLSGVHCFYCGAHLKRPLERASRQCDECFWEAEE